MSRRRCIRAQRIFKAGSVSALTSSMPNSLPFNCSKGRLALWSTWNCLLAALSVTEASLRFTPSLRKACRSGWIAACMSDRNILSVLSAGTNFNQHCRRIGPGIHPQNDFRTLSRRLSASAWLTSRCSTFAENCSNRCSNLPSRASMLSKRAFCFSRSVTRVPRLVRIRDGTAGSGCVVVIGGGA